MQQARARGGSGSGSGQGRGGAAGHRVTSSGAAYDPGGGMSEPLLEPDEADYA